MTALDTSSKNTNDPAASDVPTAGEGVSSSLITRYSWMIPLVLFALGILLYAHSVGHQLMYSWDDNRYLSENVYLRDGLNGLAGIWTNYYFAAYLPVTLSTYWLEFQAWGMNPAGYHVVNVLLHAANGVLVYYVLLRLLNKRGVAAFAAVLFLIHPLQVETVAWVAERKNLLAMFFMLLAMLAHFRSSDPDKAHSGIHRVWLPLAWLLFALAALSKPIVVGAPLLFIAYDWWWRGMSLRSAVVRNLVSLAIGGVAALLIILAHDEGGGIKDYRGGSPLIALQIMLAVFWDYVVSLVLPVNLNNRYFYPVDEVVGSIKVIFGAAVLVFMGIFAWRQPLGKPFSRYAMLWIVVFMLPVINIVPINIERADRYMYFPSIVIFALVGLFLNWLWTRFNSTEAHYMLVGAGVVIILPLMLITFNRSMVWQNEGALWRDHLRTYPDSETGLLNLGVYYFNEREYPEAQVTFEQLLTLYPNHFKGYRFLGHIAFNEGRYEDAVPYYQRALQLVETDTMSHYYLGTSYYNLGDYAHAIPELNETIRLNPSYNRQMYINLGDAALRSGDYTLAERALTVALQYAPSAEIASNLCAAEAEIDQVSEAVQHCRAAVEAEPENGLYLGRLAHVLRLAGDLEGAMAAAQSGIAAAPNLSLNYRVMGEVYEASGDTENAIAAYRAALERDSDNRRALEGLARLTGEGN
jgi:tetratricopeptide (TPR) repeat protein